MGHTSTYSAIGPTLLERLLGLAVAIAAMAGAAPAIAGDLTITPSVELREIFSDNVDLDPDGLDESAFITEFVPGFTLRSESARATAALNAFPIVRYQTAGEDKGFTLAGDLEGLGTVEVEEDLFFIDGQASISQQVLNNRSSGSTADEDTIGVLRVSPYLRNRFGGFAEGEARYALSQVWIGGQKDLGPFAVSDSTEHSVKLSLDSGTDFSRLKWEVIGRASYDDRSDDDDVERWETGLLTEYAINRSISVIAGAGYQFFDDGDPANDVDDPAWQIGFHWRPGPRTDLRVTYGQFDGDESANMKFSYKISSRTSITASYSEILENSQERLARNTSFIDLDSETDQFIDPQTGLPFDPNQSPFNIGNETTRTETFRIGLNGSRGRNNFGLNAAIGNEEIESTGRQEDNTTLGARFSRQLNPHLTANIFAGYERTEFDDGRVDDEYSATAGVNYELYANLRAGLRYEFTTQDSTSPASEFTENRVTVSLRMTF